MFLRLTAFNHDGYDICPAGSSPATRQPQHTWVRFPPYVVTSCEAKILQPWDSLVTSQILAYAWCISMVRSSEDNSLAESREINNVTAKDNQKTAAFSEVPAVRVIKHKAEAAWKA